MLIDFWLEVSCESRTVEGGPRLSGAVEIYWGKKSTLNTRRTSIAIVGHNYPFSSFVDISKCANMCDMCKDAKK